MIDHRDTMLALLNAARVLRLSIEDLPGAILAAKRDDELDPFLDPTAWISNGKALREDINMMNAALPLWTLADSLMRRDSSDGVA